jgi:hypothetical protein
LFFLCNKLGGDIILVCLTQNKKAIIDASDYKKICKHKWFASYCSHTESFYAVTNINKEGGIQTRLYMARLILEADSNTIVDHINHDTLDNRRCNLRACTLSENARNRIHQGGSSKYKGVFWKKANGKWCAQISEGGRKIYLGLYNNEIEAALAYDNRAKADFGRYALLNKEYFPEDFLNIS